MEYTSQKVAICSIWTVCPCFFFQPLYTATELMCLVSNNSALLVVSFCHWQRRNYSFSFPAYLSQEGDVYCMYSVSCYMYL